MRPHHPVEHARRRRARHVDTGHVGHRVRARCQSRWHDFRGRNVSPAPPRKRGVSGAAIAGTFHEEAAPDTEKLDLSASQPEERRRRRRDDPSDARASAPPGAHGRPDDAPAHRPPRHRACADTNGSYEANAERQWPSQRGGATAEPLQRDHCSRVSTLKTSPISAASGTPPPLSRPGMSGATATGIGTARVEAPCA